jgi:hypothetical protein
LIGTFSIVQQSGALKLEVFSLQSDRVVVATLSGEGTYDEGRNGVGAQVECAAGCWCIVGGAADFSSKVSGSSRGHDLTLCWQLLMQMYIYSRRAKKVGSLNELVSRFLVV